MRLLDGVGQSTVGVVSHQSLLDKELMFQGNALPGGDTVVPGQEEATGIIGDSFSMTVAKRPMSHRSLEPKKDFLFFWPFVGCQSSGAEHFEHNGAIDRKPNGCETYLL